MKKNLLKKMLKIFPVGTLILTFAFSCNQTSEEMKVTQEETIELSEYLPVIIRRGDVTLTIHPQTSVKTEITDSLIYLHGYKSDDEINIDVSAEGTSEDMTTISAGQCRVEKKSAKSYLLTPTDADNFSVSVSRREEDGTSHLLENFRFKIMD